jgi:molybdopterin converting factor small subunit
MITVRYFAGARAAAGVAEETVPAGTSLADLVTSLGERHGARLSVVLRSASFLVDGVACRDRDRDRDRVLPESTVVDVLPPFAGG